MSSEPVAFADSPQNDPSPTRASISSRLSFSITGNQTQRLGQALNDATEELYKKLNIVYVSLFAFFVIGLLATACVAFGIVELVNDDELFNSKGLGEVLTVLGLYFSLPYFLLVIVFFVITNRIRALSYVGRFISLHSRDILFGFVVLLYLLQQGLASHFIVLNRNNVLWYYAFIGDAIVLAILVWRRRGYPWGQVAHSIYLSFKLVLLWETTEDLNKVASIVFLSVPFVQFSLYASYMSNASSKMDHIDRFKGDVERGGDYNGTGPDVEQHSRGGVLEQHALNFNLYLSHLMHSVDIIALVLFVFDCKDRTPYLHMLFILFVCCFLINNLSFLHLFYNRPGVSSASIPIPYVRDVAARSARDHNDAVRARRSEAPESNEAPLLHGQAISSPVQASPAGLRGRSRELADVQLSHSRRLFQYMLLIVSICDVPLLLSRLQLIKTLPPLPIVLIAKNIKDVVDAAMLTLKVYEAEALAGDYPSATRSSRRRRNRGSAREPLVTKN